MPSAGVRSNKKPCLRDERSWGIAHWLMARQDAGLHRHMGLRCRNSRLDPNKLISKVAWSSWRLQNMILAVGPSTPASVLMSRRNTTSGNQSRSGSFQRHANFLFGYGYDESSESEDEGSMQDSSVVSIDGSNTDATDDTTGQASPQSHIVSRTETLRRRLNQPSNLSPSIRHGGCINTACWIDSPWRLSLGTPTSLSANCTVVPGSAREVATQLLTSGDDRVAKIWDVSSAMGSSSPQRGGWDTFLPLADYESPEFQLKTKSAWAEHFHHCSKTDIPGFVAQVASVHTRHTGNVLHATPVYSLPGKLLTCSVDGSLRLSDINSDSSCEVRSEGEAGGSRSMAFQHVMLTDNTGLLCSQTGLHRFDLRLASRQQEKHSVLDSSDNDLNYCKACIVWSLSPEGRCHGGRPIESNYVLAGGDSSTVSLFDLRATGSKVVERYRPRSLTTASSVSVSGLDLTRDGKQLLVSYKNDQIYTFPVLQSCDSNLTVELIDQLANSRQVAVPDVMSYGCHQNQFTFLKVARFAGLNDEFICSGSDSGLAWIYDRNTSTVVTALGADKTTCNGLVPHDSLPFFVSYGIDSTAKLWRASCPVDHKADDSAAGRARRYQRSNVRLGQLTLDWNSWKHVEMKGCQRLLPDMALCDHQSDSSPLWSRSIDNENPRCPFVIGNSSRLLPDQIQYNLCNCFKADQKVRYLERFHAPAHSLDQFSHICALSRLRLQSERLGLDWNPCIPWSLDPFRPKPSGKFTHKVDPADCVPDFPSDWLLLDPAMRGTPFHRINRNEDAHAEALRQFYGDSGDFQSISSEWSNSSPPWLCSEILPDPDEVADNEWCLDEHSEFTATSRQFFLATINLLKTGGSEALQKGDIATAARRYDKGVQYCAVALTEHGESEVDEERRGLLRHLSCSKALGCTSRWTSLRRLLVCLRLNLCLLMLNRVTELTVAREQGHRALDQLSPFISKVASPQEKGKDEVKQIRSLLTKTYFRLGSVEFFAANYEESVQWLQKARMVCNPEDDKTVKLVARRLHEAKQNFRKDRKARKC